MTGETKLTDGPFRLADLYANGAVSDETYVTTAKIPPFGKPPHVLLWGIRVFLLTLEGGERSRPVYVEGFGYAIPDSYTYTDGARAARKNPV